MTYGTWVEITFFDLLEYLEYHEDAGRGAGCQRGPRRLAAGRMCSESSTNTDIRCLKQPKESGRKVTFKKNLHVGPRQVRKSSLSWPNSVILAMCRPAWDHEDVETEKLPRYGHPLNAIQEALTNCKRKRGSGVKQAPLTGQGATVWAASCYTTLRCMSIV